MQKSVPVQNVRAHRKDTIDSLDSSQFRKRRCWPAKEIILASLRGCRIDGQLPVHARSWRSFAQDVCTFRQCGISTRVDN